MDFTMQNATLEDLNELSLLMNQAHKTMEHPNGLLPMMMFI